MKNIVLGTAGHVDHGKTALIKALTGIDTDRLKEEKERGITIDLGFASLTLPNGQSVGIVDVPGHEKFIRNMVSGASGIDMVVMVIAADEGIMPQTREHLHICSFLGIKTGIIALTKIDLVDKQWLDVVADDIKEFVKESFLEGAPVIPVSSLTGEGLPEFMEGLAQLAAHIVEEADTGIFRLPIDRIFTMKGFGTVVTGTLVSGHVCVGDGVEILPLKTAAKVRGIQVHNRAVARAEAGQRTAINLQGVEKSVIARGNVLSMSGIFEPSYRLDIFFEYLPYGDKKLKNRSLLRFHAGTSEAMARLILQNQEEMEPGGKGYAQVVLETPTVAEAGDRFVIRSYSPVTTIGGGVVLDPSSKKQKRYSESATHEMRLLHGGADEQKAQTIIERSGLAGISPIQLVIRTGIPRHKLEMILEKLISEREAVLLDREDHSVLSNSAYRAFQWRIVAEVQHYHQKYPLREGLRKEEIRTTVGQFAASKLFNRALKDLENEGELVINKEHVRMPSHQVQLQGELEELKSQIILLYSKAGLTPPSMKEIMEKFAQHGPQCSHVMSVMIKEGLLIKVNEDLCFHVEAIQTLRENYKKLLLREGKATPASFKELTGLSRKFIIPLMEYFDMTKLTVRAGEHRILRERTAKQGEA
jgi:selenocysteine-specific elongation factor